MDSGSVPLFNLSTVLERAGALLPKFRAAIGDISPEAGFGGVWESEMLLFCAAIEPYAPKQILESGRGRGKSTLILARCFPEAQIISVELDPHSPNAPVAEAKLKPYGNVKLLCGDSRKLLPECPQRAMRCCSMAQKTSVRSGWRWSCCALENRARFLCTTSPQGRQRETSSPAIGLEPSLPTNHRCSAFARWMIKETLFSTAGSDATEFSPAYRPGYRSRSGACA